MATSSDSISILVLSDFHACRRPARARNPDPTHFTISAKGERADVARDFIEHLEKEKILADIVLCAGDLIDKTDNGALDDAWTFANEIQKQVKAKDLLTCTGNHDIDWKGVTPAFNPFQTLKLLHQPRYPTANDEEWQSYWSRHYFIRETALARIVVINSCSALGYKKQDKGLFPPEAEMLVTDLKKKAPKPINICLCHHHPHRHGDHGLGELDDMVRSQVLTDALSSYDIGQWLIIHGHKHHPKISYAQGNSFSPVVFSSGSFSARIWEQLQNYARNQCHLLKFEVPAIERHRRLVGEYRSWSWFPKIGWREAGDSEGLPALGGFGYRDAEGLATRVSAKVKALPAIAWHDIIAEFDAIRYLIPSDFAYFLRILAENGIKIDEEKVAGKTTIKQLIR